MKVNYIHIEYNSYAHTYRSLYVANTSDSKERLMEKTTFKTFAK